MNASIVISSVCAAVTFAPPILPFTEIGEEKMETLAAHMVAAKEITKQDCDVVLQLDHIRWKYERMRQEFYNSAKKANNDQIIYVKDLGKIFDKIDSALDEEKEAFLQEKNKKQKEAEKQQPSLRDEA